jgi:cysteine synthase
MTPRHPFRAVAVTLVVAALVTAGLGCGTAQLVAPAGRNVRIMRADAPASVHVERTVWFYSWGAKPISDNTTREDIEKYNLREVRMDVYQKWYEMLINPITSIVSIQRRTLIVEGNP